MKLRYGILSTANVAPRVIDAIRQEGTGEVIAIASREISKAIQFAEEHRIHKAYGSYEVLFLDSDVDIVYIPTVNQAHFQNAKDALEHGKHVLVEKPFTLKLSESEKLFQLAKEKKRFI
ncbi:MAG: Gfo/Idh/MocA family oxidoreductase, partial [Streptococcaceae bacterium]|nr:Gfo/Idh/MocA family oxidoreductase [Streptococcaceae bacterium]